MGIPPYDDGSWGRAIADSASAATLADALAAGFEQLLPRSGVVAAAVVEGEPAQVVGAWKCEPPDVERRLLGLQLTDGRFPDRAPSVGPLDTAALRVVPLPCVEGRHPHLVFFVPPSSLPVGDLPPTTEKLIPGVAALAGLLVEREFHAEAARRAKQTRAHFLVAVHHEVRTPATALMLEAGLLQSGLLGALPPRLQASLARLDQRVGELIRVVQRVIDLAQLEAAVEPPRSDLLDPRATIVETARHVEPAAEEKGVSLSVFFPRRLPLIQTDADRFRRILLYLLGNALKFSDQGRIQIRVERIEQEPGSRQREPLLAVRVIDSGRGIPAEELKRIFEPFAQVEEGARTDSGQRGVGLGLSLARKLARSLGGDIEVESVVGRGTTASFVVPYAGSAASG